MSNDPEFHSSSKQPTPLRFMQIVQVGSDEESTLVGLTFDGKLYQRYYDEDAAVLVWRPAQSFSSTELVKNLRCSACGMEYTKGFPEERCLRCYKGTLLPRV